MSRAAPRLRAGLAALALVAAAASAAAQGKVTKPPRPKETLAAPYPEAEKAEGRSASVVLRLSIAPDGAVTAVEVVEGASPAFDAAAVDTAKKLRFEPAEIDGKPAAVRILYRFKFEIREEKPKHGSVAGVLRDRKTKAPRPNVRVSLDDGRTVTTDADGKFRFTEVEPGKHALTLEGEGLVTQRTEETFEAGKRLDAVYDVDVKQAPAPGEEADDYEVVIKAPPLEKKVTSTDVSAAEARKTAGTQGDVLKVVESLPGVARPGAGTASIVVWGAAPEDTRVYVDGVRIPRLYHEGGVRSVVSGELVKSVELSPGGHGAAWGRSLGGVVRVTTLPLDDLRLRGATTVDLLDTSIALRAPVTSRLSVGVGARRGHLDTVARSLASDDVRDVVPIPRYEDVQAKVVYRTGPREAVESLVLHARDRIERTVPSEDPSSRRSESRTVSFDRVAARWRAQGDAGESDAVFWLGRDRREIVASFGGTPTSLSEATTLVGLRGRHRLRAGERAVVEIGLDGELARSSLTRDGSITRPPREGDPRLFGVPPSSQVGTDAWSTTLASVATYAEVDLSALSGRLHVVPGVRFEPWVVGVSRKTPVVGETPAIGDLREDTAIAPRLSARFEVAKELEVRAAWGRYHQGPQPEDLSPVFGNPALSLSRATQAVAGVAVKPVAGLTTEITAFRTVMDDLAVRSRSASPKAAEALVQEGSGRSFGAQWLVRLDRPKGPRGWIAYTLSRSERTDGPGLSPRLFDYDQTHVLTALASTDLGRGVSVSFRFRYATGARRTPVVDAYLDARTGRYEPVLGRTNGERLPAFVQLDLRAEKRFRIDRDTELELYLDLLNATSQKNAEEVVYSTNFERKKYVTGLPILPVAGARLTW